MDQSLSYFTLNKWKDMSEQKNEDQDQMTSIGAFLSKALFAILSVSKNNLYLF